MGICGKEKPRNNYSKNTNIKGNEEEGTNLNTRTDYNSYISQNPKNTNKDTNYPSLSKVSSHNSNMKNTNQNENINNSKNKKIQPIKNNDSPRKDHFDRNFNNSKQNYNFYGDVSQNNVNFNNFNNNQDTKGKELSNKKEEEIPMGFHKNEESEKYFNNCKQNCNFYGDVPQNNVNFNNFNNNQDTKGKELSNKKEEEIPMGFHKNEESEKGFNFLGKMAQNNDNLNNIDFNEVKIDPKKEKEKSNDFYDMILDFNSFEQLKKGGWTAKFTKQGKINYDNCIKQSNVVIGIIGNKNRGKSYLLGRILDIPQYDNPNGFLVTTSGISCKFPILKVGEESRVFVTLDTAGRDNPLLRMEYLENKDPKSIACDQKVTESVLSDFIMEQSDILIAVLEQLSFAEQELLKNIINQLRQTKTKNSISKKLIVIHNLRNISTVKDIDKFINNILLRSLTFSLTNLDPLYKNNYIFSQNMDDKEGLEIFHVVIGKNGLNEKELTNPQLKRDILEIKKKINEPIFDYIRKHIIVATQRKFDFVNYFKELISTNSSKYMNGKGFKENSLELGEAIEDNKNIIIPIKLKENINEFNLKCVYVNSTGIRNFLSAIEPRYSSRIIKKENKYYLEIEFELYGQLINEIKTEIDIDDNNQYLISFNGKVEETNKNSKKLYNKNINKILEYGEFYFQAIIKKYIKINDKDFELDLNENAEPSKILDESKFGVYKYLFEADLNEYNRNYD